MSQKNTPQSTSPYPRDRFDDVAPYTDRRGVHRSAPPAGAGPSGLVGISIAAALALVVGAFCFLILPSLLPSDTGGAAANAGAAVSTPSGTPVGAAQGTAEGSGGTGTPGGTASAGAASSASTETQSSAAAVAEPSESATEEPSPSETALPDTGDTSAPVEVYNATRVGGLAGRVSGSLSADGFAVVSSANWQGFAVQQSAVYYSRNVTTAQAVASQLGLPLVQDPRIPGIAVVLAADYSG